MISFRTLARFLSFDNSLITTKKMTSCSPPFELNFGFYYLFFENTLKYSYRLRMYSLRDVGACIIKEKQQLKL